MEQTYIIEADIPDRNHPVYYCSIHAWTLHPQSAKRFIKDSAYLGMVLDMIPKEYNPRLVDYRHVIGTYISTRSKKHIFSNYLIVTLCLILIPILIPIIVVINIKDKIVEYITK